LTGTIFLHAHLQAVYYNCVKFHLNPMRHLGGIALTSPSLHTERISEYKFLTGTIFLHAHLQAVYYNCVKFHKNPISRLGGVALTRYMPTRFRESIS
jgi:trehalose utilization protein